MIKVVNKNTVLFSLDDEDTVVYTIKELMTMPEQKIKDLIMYYAETEKDIKIIYGIRGWLYL